MLDLLYNTIYAYFVSLSIITRIELYSCPVYSSFKGSDLTIKSIVIDF